MSCIWTVPLELVWNPGCYVLYLEDFMIVSRFLCKLMESYENSWELMGTYENLWELMGTYGNLWELMGT